MSAHAPHYRPLADLEADLRALPNAPRDVGRVALIVRRPSVGVRETPGRVHLSAEEGVPGDDWSRRPPHEPDAQLAVMRRDVAELIASGRSLALFGDNLLVDMDLSEANLPTGSRLRVGQALVEVTAKPHNGCLKFKERFGLDALRLVSAVPTRDQNLRGIYWRVLEDGQVAVGDEVRVIERTRPRGEASP
jgi:MOSC domain-containing protein YiiM